MNLLKHLPQFQWPFRSTADRYAKDYLAEERSGSGQDDRQPWALTFSEWVSLFSGVKHLEERVSALAEKEEGLRTIYLKEIPLALKSRLEALEDWRETIEFDLHQVELAVTNYLSRATPAPDSTPGLSPNEETHSSLSDASHETEPTLTVTT